MVATYTPIAIAPTINAVITAPLLLFLAISYAETPPESVRGLVAY